MKKAKNTSIYIFISIVLMILCIEGLSVTSYTENIYDFENFTEDDAMDFIIDNNIEIPAKLLDLEDLPSFTKDVIIQAYKNPSTPFSFNYSKTQKYAEDIRLAVCSYIAHADISKLTNRL